MDGFIRVVGFMAAPMSIILSFLYDFIQNYGITILAFTLVVKVALYPLHAKQVKSSVKMAEMQPKMKELQTRYANNNGHNKRNKRTVAFSI